MSAVPHGLENEATNGESAVRDQRMTSFDIRPLFSKTSDVQFQLLTRQPTKEGARMFDTFGQQVIGHGVIKQIDLSLMEAQIGKRNCDQSTYNKNILDELRAEQPDYYGVVQGLAESLANERCQRDTPDWEFWMNWFMFSAAFTYKIICVGIESQWMNEDFRL